MEEVLEFIHRRFPQDCNWTSGNCYYFASILYMRFPDSEIWYDEINNHFVCKISDVFYDWNGVYKSEYELVRWKDFKDIDILLFNRIIRDCIK